MPKIGDDRDECRDRRSVARFSTLAEQGREDDLAGTTVEERLAMMWPLALDSWAFMGEAVPGRLPRHLARRCRR